MTDNEIIKALKCCEYTDELCYMCPEIKDSECIQRLHTMALDLISRQRAEIEYLKSIKFPCGIQVEVSTKIENEIKSEAIKEFAERLKEGEVYMRIEFPNTKNGTEDYIVLSDDIDDLVKEMTEVKENEKQQR